MLFWLQLEQLGVLSGQDVVEGDACVNPGLGVVQLDNGHLG